MINPDGMKLPDAIFDGKSGELTNAKEILKSREFTIRVFKSLMLRMLLGIFDMCNALTNGSQPKWGPSKFLLMIFQK